MHHPPRPDTRRRPLINIVVTTTAEQTVVAVTGEIDVSVTDRLRERLGEELSLNPRALIVDLTGIRFCCARGLTVLLDTLAAASLRDIPIAVAADGRAVRRLVQLLQLHQVLPLHRNRADAEDWLAITAAFERT
jgi:anti-sigma B factor antagonist